MTPRVSIEDNDDDSFEEVEYGYRTPDGKDHFGLVANYAKTGSGQKLDLASKEGQGIAQDNFIRQVGFAGIPIGNMKLVFLKRVRFVNYSTPEVI